MARRFSLRAKFTGATTLVAAMAVLLATVSYLFYQSASSRDALLNELRTIAQVIAHNSTAALAFGDRAAAAEILAALRAKPDIVRGEIVSAAAGSLADYRSESGAAEDSGTVALVEAVVLDGDRIGEIRLTASLGRLAAERRTFVLISLAIAVAAIAVALALSTLLRRVMLRPILHLAETMTRVSEAKDYSRRARRLGNDELGDLIDGFNGMVAQIEQQHRELGDYRNRLERLVEARTRALEGSNRELHQAVLELAEARAKAEAASRAKSEFLANMSHELRTPLNAILGFSEMMLRRVFGPLGHDKYVEYTRDIHHSGSHLVGVIGDILDVVRIEVGKLALHDQPIEPAAIVEDAVRLIRPSADAKGVRLEAPALTVRLPRLRADPVRLRQILLNLLSNAVKFTDAGGRVAIEACVTDMVEIRVADTGIGIAAADLDKVLTPFGQVEGPFARRHQGTGLGLSLSKMLVEQHGGTLSLRSAPGVGTTVTITLPADRIVAVSLAQAR